jgi:hypothetical protein
MLIARIKEENRDFFVRLEAGFILPKLPITYHTEEEK